MSTSTTTTQKNKPPKWAAPLFRESAREASSLYNSGSGFNVYDGSRVAGLSDQTMTGINALSQPYAGSNTANSYGNLLNQANTAAGTQFNAQTVNPQNLQDTIDGKYLESGNPYYMNRLSQQIDDANARIKSAYSGSGRYGSSAFGRTLADNTSNMLMQGLETDYNRERQNQLAAIQMQLGADQFNSQQGLNAQGMQASNMLSALGLGNTITGNDFQASQAQGQNALAAGQVLDQNNQAMLSDDVQRWYDLDNQDWTRLGALQAAASGSAGNYGTQVATQTQPFNYLGAAGALGSLGKSAMSDARMKTDIEPVGMVDGITVWEWRYKGLEGRYRGVMAQDVMDTHPDAVVDVNGLLMVRYDRLPVNMERLH